jgi:hypothetical protein
MARPRKPESLALSAPARFWVTKAEYRALGRYARLQGKTISALMRDVLLATMTADARPSKRDASGVA